MFKPRTFEIPLYQGDWQQRVAQSEQKVAAAEQRASAAEKRARDGQVQPRTMDETDTEVDRALAEVDRLVAEHNALVERADADGCTRVTLQALGRRRWNDLVAAHPPRTDKALSEDTRKNDAELGVDDDGFGEALLPESIVAVSDDTPLDQLLDLVSSFQYDLLYQAAFALNRDGGRAPKALTPSSSTAATENSPAP